MRVTVEGAIFVLIAAVILASAARVVTAQNLVHAALFLMLSLAGTAALFILISAEFLAWVQVLIYVGAVVVLFLFGIMLTRAPIGKTTDLDNARGRPWALLAGLLFLGVMGIVLWRAYGAAPPAITGSADYGVREIGNSLMTDWVIPFEAVSLVLLAALIGGLVLARKDAQ